MTNVFLFKIQAADIDLCCFSQGTRAKKRLFTFFGVVPCQKLFWNNVKDFFLSVDLIEASGVLEKIKCLGLTGKERDVLFSHCLLLARFYIFSCKYKSWKPSIVELYITLKTTLYLNWITNFNFKGTEKIFEEKWKKIIQKRRLFEWTLLFLLAFQKNQYKQIPKDKMKNLF